MWHWIRHWSTRDNCSRNWRPDSICHMCWGWNIHWCANGRNKGSSYGLSNASCSIYANTRGSSWQRCLLFALFARRITCSRTICLAGNQTLRHWNFSSVDTGDVMYTWPSPVPIHRVQTNKVFLSMTGDLCRSTCHNKISGDTSPITFPVFVQSKKEQSVFKSTEIKHYEVNRQFHL